MHIDDYCLVLYRSMMTQAIESHSASELDENSCETRLLSQLVKQNTKKPTYERARARRMGVADLVQRTLV